MKLTSMPSDSFITKQIRESLQRISDSPNCNLELRTAVDDILAGRSDITSLLTAPGAADAAERGMQTYRQQRSILSPEQRRQVDESARIRAEELNRSDPLIRGIMLGRISTDH